jgi:hypothetical protein
LLLQIWDEVLFRYVIRKHFFLNTGRRGCDRMVVRFTTTFVNSNPAQCTTLCDKIYQRLVTGQWFSVATLVSSTDRHDITQILLKVALNTITLNPFLLQQICERV